MGLLDRIKNALFEEEEVEVPLKVNQKELDRKRLEEERKKIEKEEQEIERLNSREKKPQFDSIQDDEKKAPISFRSEKTFEFPIFDENEFQDSKDKNDKNKNILEYERRSKIEKRLDFNKQVPEVKEEKKFKPSPIISPVYGVIDGEFSRDELPKPAKKSEVKRKAIDVDMIRNKAFGTLEDEIETLVETPQEEIIEDNSKTIDELLTSTADETISVEDVLDEIINGVEKVEDINAKFSEEEEVMPRSVPLSKFNIKEELESVLEDIEIKEDSIATFDINEDTRGLDVLDKIDKLQDEEEKLENETLESDLFDLIDSMYENGKDEN